MWNGTENQITLLMLRHGATTSNREHRYLGQTDEALSIEGKKELSDYKRLRCYPFVQYLFSSPMKRCVETAKILYPDLYPIIIPEWREMDFGAFEGKNYIELKGDKRYQAWIDSNGTIAFPEGESRENFMLRCDNGFQRMLEKIKVITEQNKSRTKSIGMLVHGGTIMALLHRYYGGNYFDYQVANGKGYICKLKTASAKPIITELKKI